MLTIEYDGCQVSFECEVDDSDNYGSIGFTDDGESVNLTKLLVNGVEVDFAILKEESDQWINFSEFYECEQAFSNATTKFTDDDGIRYILDDIEFNGGKFYIQLNNEKVPDYDSDYTWQLLRAEIGGKEVSYIWGRLLMDGGALEYPLEFVDELKQAMFTKWKEANSD